MRTSQICKFTGKSYFTGALFENVDLSNTKFTKSSYYVHSEFYNASFYESTFSENAIFSYSMFHEAITFKRTTFGNSITNNINFNKIKIKNNSTIQFNNSNIIGEFNFDHANSNGQIIFDNSTFNAQSSFLKAKLGFASFKLCKFKFSPIMDRTDLRTTELINSPIESFRFMACIWPTSSGRRVTYDSRRTENTGYFALDNVSEIMHSIS